jgi:high-affinity iron transporter
MIINTVVLFLRDLLPVFIIFSYLSVLLEHKVFNDKPWLLSLLFGCVLAVVFSLTAQYITEWFDGSGLEIVRTVLLSLVFLLLIYSLYASSNNEISTHVRFMFIAAGSLFILEKGSSFLLFFNVYIQQEGNLLNTLIGCFVGLGICTSFSILFRFTLKELLSKQYILLVISLWSLFLAGQVSGVLHYLSQVDIITLDSSLLNVNTYVSDSSELGHMLKALVGFESSPSLSFIVMYVLAFLMSFALSKNIFMADSNPTNRTEPSNAI